VTKDFSRYLGLDIFDTNVVDNVDIGGFKLDAQLSKSTVRPQKNFHLCLFDNQFLNRSNFNQFQIFPGNF
jgi:hypothetical protein